MGLSTAVVAAAAIGAAGGIASGAMGASAAGDAADAQRQSAADANALQWKMYSQNRSDMLPWMSTGKWALNQLKSGLQPGGRFNQFTLQDFKADPGYQWRMQQGLDAVRAGSAAAGSFGSGNMGAALQDYGQNIATNEFSNAYGRWQDQYNKYAGLANVGQNQSQALGSMGMSAASNMGQNLLYSGQAQAQGIMGANNAWMGGIQNAFNQGINGWNLYNQQNLLSSANASGSMPTNWTNYNVPSGIDWQMPATF